MKKAARALASVVTGLTNFSGWIAALCLVSAAFIVTEAVIIRKILGMSTIWQTEACVFLLIFTVFTGAPFVQKHEHHLNVDLLIIYLPPKAREITLVAVSVISCIIAGILAWYSWPMWWESVLIGEHSESLWGPPMWIPYFFLPAGMTMLFFQYIVQIVKKIRALQKGEIKEEAARFELKDVKLKGPETGSPDDEPPEKGSSS
ncbi:MAG: TRAP transporter small permease [Desulfobacteraceae bacterium]